jgi:hypothetical protein
VPFIQHRWLILPVAATLLLSACGQQAPAAVSKSKPATVEKIAGSNLSRVVLTDEAAQRIDLRTELVGDALEGGTTRRFMPYTAIIYDKAGDTWAYTPAAEPRTFVRERVSVDSIKGNVAYLRDGPAVGTHVVTVGQAELYGAEIGVGK